MRRTTSEGVHARGAGANTPVLFDAIELTMRTFEARSRLYRNLVVVVSLVSVASIGSALILWHWPPLFGLVLLVPLVGGYVQFDGRRVRHWSSGIVDLCDRGLELEAFRTTLLQFKHLPQSSLHAMLAALPAEPVVR